MTGPRPAAASMPRKNGNKNNLSFPCTVPVPASRLVAMLTGGAVVFASPGLHFLYRECIFKQEDGILTIGVIWDCFLDIPVTSMDFLLRR